MFDQKRLDSWILKHKILYPNIEYQIDGDTLVNMKVSGHKLDRLEFPPVRKIYISEYEYDWVMNGINSVREIVDKEIVIPDTVEIIGPYTIDRVNIPEDYEGTLIIPSSVKRICCSAIYGGHKLDVKFTGEIPDLGVEAFAGTKFIKNFKRSTKKYLSRGNKILLINSSLAEFTLEDGMIFGEGCCQLSRLREVTIKGKLDEIPKGCFYLSMHLQKVNFLNTVNKIGLYSFYSCSIKEMEIPSSVKFIDELAFNYSHLENIKLNEGLLGIGKDAFLGTSLKRVELPKSLKFICNDAFNSTRHLKEIVIHDTTKVIRIKSEDKNKEFDNIYENHKENFIILENGDIEVNGEYEELYVGGLHSFAKITVIHDK